MHIMHMQQGWHELCSRLCRCACLSDVQSCTVRSALYDKLWKCHNKALICMREPCQPSHNDMLIVHACCRWTTSGCPDSRSSLQIKLLEDGSKQELAHFSGPGTKCKSYWIQNPDFAQDSITMFGRTDYPTWMQVVVASGLVAAKTQRRIDKSLQRSR